MAISFNSYVKRLTLVYVAPSHSFLSLCRLEYRTLPGRPSVSWKSGRTKSQRYEVIGFSSMQWGGCLNNHLQSNVCIKALLQGHNSNFFLAFTHTHIYYLLLYNRKAGVFAYLFCLAFCHLGKVCYYLCYRLYWSTYIFLADWTYVVSAHQGVADRALFHNHALYGSLLLLSQLLIGLWEPIIILWRWRGYCTENRFVGSIVHNYGT